MHFPVSGVDCPLWLPPLVAFAVSAVTAAAGLSGAFLLLPFQVSVLGFAGPAVTPTNLVYNIFASPGGIYGYASRRRMHWPLAATLIAGTLPGVFLGAFVRIRFLPDPRNFKLFAGCVLLYAGAHLLWKSRRFAAQDPKTFPRSAVLALAFAVGLVGGIYGIGGGAIIAPFLAAAFGMPVSAIAGATLLTTFATSAAGAAAFELLELQPDWALGALFGAGGLAGTFAGARLQRYVPERGLRIGLGLLVCALAATYITGFFRH